MSLFYVENKYIVSCRPEWEQDPVILDMESIGMLLDYLVNTGASRATINILHDLARRLNVEIEEKI